VIKKKAHVAAALIAGLLFGLGLIVGGMTLPSKVIGFLDIAGDWDPSLAFVMAGGIAVFMPLFRIITRRSAPMLTASFAVPTRRDLDGPLILGAALFGIGWGLAGYCPGPAITSVSTLAPSSLLFAAAMVAGFGLKRGYDALRAHLATRSAAEAEANVAPTPSAQHPAWEK
jgi:uncharacterized membrane protein YedE/YeeE